jgi:rhodanese-related sulfurtransferase
VGFRWDGTLQRWVKDKRVSANVWTEVPKMQTRTGGDYVIWPVLHSALVDAGLRSVSTEEAKALADKGAVFVDIRTPKDFGKEHIPGAVNVPMFVPVVGTKMFDQIKKVVMATAFAMAATERNQNFAEDAQKALQKKGKQIVVYCGRGGKLTTGIKGRRGTYDDPDRQFGIESRSLKACYELIQAGFTNIVHLEGGLSRWRYEGNPTEK